MSEMKHAGADLTATKSVYETLRAVNVSDHTEKKNGLTYLSWAWAWDTLMLHFPDSYVDVKRDKNGRFWFDDGFTGWVEVEVVVNGISRSELFPIMDYKNKSIPADQITSFSANTAVQRATTKAIARHGLGLYVYAGEDLPPTEQQSADIFELYETAVKKLRPLLESMEEIGEDLNSQKNTEYIKKTAKIKTADPAVLYKEGDADGLSRLIKVYEKMQKGTDKRIGEKMMSDSTPTF